MMQPFKDNYHVIVKAEDRELIDSFYKVIVWHINQQKHIPYGIVASFLNCLYDAKELKYDELSIKAEALAKIAIEKLSGKKEYQFSWHSRVETLEVGPKVIEYNTERVFYECIFGFLLMNQDLKKVEKEDAISFFYEALTEEYFKKLKYPDEIEEKIFKPYKWMVITGLLTQVVGYKLTTKKKPTNEEIFQATRNAIRKNKADLDLLP